jgi:ABC-type branched-subunit amino acid transport system ATPase component
MSFELWPGQVVGLMGPNGAGKTTVFEMVSGFLTPDTGSVFFQGEDITRQPVHERAKRGIARGFQDARLFPSLTVEETVQLSLDRHLNGRVDLLGMLLGLKSSRRAERWIARRADEIIERYGLGPHRDKPASALSTGTRRVLEIAVVMAQEPTLILLDEPSAGVAHAESEAMARLLTQLRQEDGLSILLIEHDVPMILGLSDRIYVMDAGRLLAAGVPDEVANDPLVLESYFGTKAVSTGEP